MTLLFAAMLNERRILVKSDRLTRLTGCVQAANSLIYPMQWQHIFIPILPKQLLDYLNAPMPFLIGVPSSLLQASRPIRFSGGITSRRPSSKLFLANPYPHIAGYPNTCRTTRRPNWRSWSSWTPTTTSSPHRTTTCTLCRRTS